MRPRYFVQFRLIDDFNGHFLAGEDVASQLHHGKVTSTWIIQSIQKKNLFKNWKKKNWKKIIKILYSKLVHFHLKTKDLVKTEWWNYIQLNELPRVSSRSYNPATFPS